MKINTVTKKTILLFSGIGLFVYVIVSFLFPDIFYYLMKPHLQSQVASIISTISVKQSYIWKTNRKIFSISENENLSELLSAYTKSHSDNERRLLKKSIEDYLNPVTTGFIMEYSRNTIGSGSIRSISYPILFTSNGDIFYHEDSALAAVVFKQSEWYQEFDRKNPDYFDYMPVLTSAADKDYSIFGMISSHQTKDLICYMVNCINFEDIEQLFSELDKLEINDYMLTKKGEILYQNTPVMSSLLKRCPSHLFLGGQYETVSWEDPDTDDTYFMTLITYESEDQRIGVRVPKNVLLSPYQEVFHYFRILIAAIIFILLTLFLFSQKSIRRRLMKLNRTMECVQHGNYHVSIHDSGTDEIGSLAHTFNIMLDKINQDMKRQKMQKEKERQMQYSLMVSAIDPHYIYNTLNTVTALAELGENENVIYVNNALIATLKDRLKVKTIKTFDSVRVEKEVLEQYLGIQKFLCHQKIEFAFHAAPCDLKLQIPKNIIQPLVENSIKHGIQKNKDKQNRIKDGQINVTVFSENEKIHIIVEDNGIGTDPETFSRFFTFQENEEFTENEQIRNAEHIGIYNVQMRLHYLFPNAFQFLAKSTLGEGTRIEIILPRSQ